MSTIILVSAPHDRSVVGVVVGGACGSGVLVLTVSKLRQLRVDRLLEDDRWCSGGRL